MALDLLSREFASLHPFRFGSFSYPHPRDSHSTLRVAVLDSPMEPTDPPLVGVIFVPLGMEGDWIFSTIDGHYQLLSDFSRLILVGYQEPDHFVAVYNRSSNQDSAALWDDLQRDLHKLFVALLPTSSFQKGSAQLSIYPFTPKVISSVVVEMFMGSSVGEFLVENVETEETETSENREFKRCLRFKSSPNTNQTEIRIIPESDLKADGVVEIQNIKFKLDTSRLVHPHLPLMVASLSLICSYLDEQIEAGDKPKALCLGVGGGALLTFLTKHLGFEVVGVETDSDVVGVAERYFGLTHNEFLHISIGDALEFLGNASSEVFGVPSLQYDVIMVDFGTRDAREGFYAPPMEFVGKDVLHSAKSFLRERHGILVINVVALENGLFQTLKDNCRSVFDDLFQIDGENKQNMVIICSVSPISSSLHVADNSSFFSRLSSLLLSRKYIDSITKI